MTDINKLITDNIDVWSDAIEKRKSNGRGSSSKIKLVGINNLRKLILGLAVQGRLVPQNEKDEGVSKLLQKITLQRNLLISEKKIKQHKALPAITNSEKPFDIPDSWSYQRFGDVMFNRDGERKPVSASERKGMQGKYDYYGASGVIDQVNDYLFDKTLLLIGEDGANLLSRTTPIAFLARGKYWVNNHAHVLDGIHTDFLEFIALHINAISLENYVTGTAQPKMNQAKMNSIVLAIPPEEEQRRITSKVSELMALCDQLEQQTEASIDAHQLLVEELLSTLTNSENAQEFEQNWARIAEHFDLLFTTEHSIEQLKQTILQLAVMGKLVTQEPSDEPASRLLEKIAQEKEKLIKDKVIKKQKALPLIKDDEKAFDLPLNWEWERLNNLSLDIHYGYTASAQHDGKGTRLLRITDIQNDKVEWESVPGCEISTEKAKTYLLENNDLLIARTGGTVGKSYLVENISVDAVFASYLIRVRRIKHFYAPYLKLFLGTNLYWSQLYDSVTGTGQPNVNATSLKSLVVPIPPENEQIRIENKVRQLLALCDLAKTKISESRKMQCDIADVIVEQALN
ncbi:restriction endonuclease subunit S [Vibrio sp. RC27]